MHINCTAKCTLLVCYTKLRNIINFGMKHWYTYSNNIEIYFKLNYDRRRPHDEVLKWKYMFITKAINYTVYKNTISVDYITMLRLITHVPHGFFAILLVPHCMKLQTKHQLLESIFHKCRGGEKPAAKVNICWVLSLTWTIAPCAHPCICVLHNSFFQQISSVIKRDAKNLVWGFETWQGGWVQAFRGIFCRANSNIPSCTVCSFFYLFCFLISLHAWAMIWSDPLQ